MSLAIFQIANPVLEGFDMSGFGASLDEE